MSDNNPIKRSLEVGFSEAKPLPEKFLRYRGMMQRSVPLTVELPFEDEQFEVVLMEGGVVTSASVREAHRVLRAAGRLYFIVPEKTSKQNGWTLPEIYSIVRDGFNIVQVERPSWWRFGRDGHTITICAQKKKWKTYKGLDNGHVIGHPFCRPYHR